MYYMCINKNFVHQVGDKTKATSQTLSPTDAQDNCLKRSIKIYIRTAPTCFGVITIIREGTI